MSNGVINILYCLISDDDDDVICRRLWKQIAQLQRYVYRQTSRTLSAHFKQRLIYADLVKQFSDDTDLPLIRCVHLIQLMPRNPLGERKQASACCAFQSAASVNAKCYLARRSSLKPNTCWSQGRWNCTLNDVPVAYRSIVQAHYFIWIKRTTARTYVKV